MTTVEKNVTEDVGEGVEVEERPPYVERICETFDEMGLNEQLLRGVYALGFEKPSSIQQRAIVPVSMGYDIIAQSQSGTGKTATFTIGCLQRVDTSKLTTQVIILAPTRELAKQNYKVCEDISEYMDIRMALCIGGEPVEENMRKLDGGVHVVVGTPGRVFDLLKRYALKMENLRSLVMDEADEMLSKGFEEQMHDIVGFLPAKSSAQICLFSATMPIEILKLTEQFLREPIRILVKNEELTLEGIKQYFVAVEQDKWKLETLCEIYRGLTVDQAIIYTNMKRKADWLTEQLRSRDFAVVCIHSEMSQRDRNKVIQDFKIGTERILIATDIIARGIDVQQVSLVINFDLPKYKETYIHRIGRSGRYGRKGLAINLVTNKDLPVIDDYRKFYRTKIDELPCDLASI